jgi:molybdate transport system substrate-binding protein
MSPYQQTRLTRRSVLAVAAVTLSTFLLAACGSDATKDQTTANKQTTATEITVAAASDLRPAFEELGKVFTERHGVQVTFSFGSSGQLREQIINGAPFDLFASANTKFVDDVIAAGRGEGSSKRNYALGRLALVAPKGKNPPETLESLAATSYKRLVIANPAHAPYGVAAQEALISAGIYPDVKDRLVLGESVSDAARIVMSGNADAGIIAQSLAIAEGIPFTLVDANAHNPLQQTLVVTATSADGRATAQLFADLVSSDTGRKTLQRYGLQPIEP